MYDVPSFIWVLTAIGVLGIPAATVAMLYRGAIGAGVGRRTAVGVAMAAGYLFAAWIVATFLLARAGTYHGASGRAVSWFGLATVGWLGVLLIASRIPLIRRVLAAEDTTARLAVPHTVRLAGVTFVAAMALGDLPAVFALPAGLGDMAIGASAPFVARRLLRDRGGARAEAVRFNVLGIVDLVAALGIGFLSGLGPLQLLHVTPTPEALTLLPLALVPTVAVPLAIALHIVSLTRLRAERRDARSDGVALLHAA
jgi:hypothetical protein